MTIFDFQEILGFLAATLTTLSFLPQFIKCYKTKKTEGLSLVMYSLFVSGVAFWLIYGILIGSKPVVVANFFTLIMASSIWWMIYKK
jgi:MtN3 and saliva related transmembrane protein